MLHNLLSTDIVNKKYLNEIDIYQNTIKKNTLKIKKDKNVIKNITDNNSKKNINFSQEKIKLKNLEHSHNNNSLILLNLIKKEIEKILFQKYNIKKTSNMIKNENIKQNIKNDDILHDMDIDNKDIIKYNNNLNIYNLLMKKKFLITANHVF
ncbi:hypothetical protein D9V74_02780 [Buchnera aphidicola (Macrosiphoniella sanborni)]|uniref:Uncharacterized protein n=1 Tax=Buchnera aphidicola (Macrosiphoniella sanborni) TaxID=1241865 RepID=A0A4D6Y433_9GAMM|nr:hypothetical protein [Buchnera aphidicola]QCI24077.1 hypothetical protein D9V74_02780 [Buchnera aphidicola (Macrosiphoniella sanborni)]